MRKGWNLVPVVVAAVDLSEGTRGDHGAALAAQRARAVRHLVGGEARLGSATWWARRCRSAIAAGDPLLWSQFESSTRRRAPRRPHLEAGPRPGRRGDTGTTGVGGWMRPNDHVDIIGSFKDPLTNEQVAVTLMQNVMVLATGKLTGTTNVNLVPGAERAYGHVSLMVLPEEAEMLVLASELGGLTFTLRNEDDLDVLEERGRATISTLLSGERTKVLQQKRFNTIQIIRGAPAPRPRRSSPRKAPPLTVPARSRAPVPHAQGKDAVDHRSGAGARRLRRRLVGPAEAARRHPQGVQPGAGGGRRRRHLRGHGGDDGHGQPALDPRAVRHLVGGEARLGQLRGRARR